MQYARTITLSLTLLLSVAQPVWSNDPPAEEAAQALVDHIRTELADLRALRLTVMAELREGKFCSECRGSPSEIYRRSGERFAEHLKAVGGEPTKMPEAEIAARIAEYDQDIADMERRLRDAETQRDEARALDNAVRVAAAAEARRREAAVRKQAQQDREATAARQRDAAVVEQQRVEDEKAKVAAERNAADQERSRRLDAMASRADDARDAAEERTDDARRQLEEARARLAAAKAPLPPPADASATGSRPDRLGQIAGSASQPQGAATRLENAIQKGIDTNVVCRTEEDQARLEEAKGNIDWLRKDILQNRDWSDRAMKNAEDIRSGQRMQQQLENTNEILQNRIQRILNDVDRLQRASCRPAAGAPATPATPATPAAE